MKKTEIDSMLLDHSQFSFMNPVPGIYAITIDDYIAYIGQSFNMRQRIGEHFYNIENACFKNVEAKYRLLLAARLGGHKLEFYEIEAIPFDTVEQLTKEELKIHLSDREKHYINVYTPPLNSIIPGSQKQNVKATKIEDVLSSLQYKIIVKNG